MSPLPGTSHECEPFRDGLVEFSLGLLAGRQRAELLAHLDGCPRCRLENEDNVAALDAILLLSPEVDPPVGFETRLVSRLGEPPVPRRHRARIISSVAAVILAIAVGIGIGSVAINPVHPHPTGSPVTTHTAVLAFDGHAIGSVQLVTGTPPWMIMSVDDAHWSGEVWCQITTVNGAHDTVGRFNLINGYGSWGVPLGVTVAEIRSARLIDARGVVLAEAALR